jgi:hypothetical protein
VLCAVCCVLCAVCCVLCAVCCVLCAVCCVLCVCGCVLACACLQVGVSVSNTQLSCSESTRRVGTLQTLGGVHGLTQRSPHGPPRPPPYSFPAPAPCLCCAPHVAGAHVRAAHAADRGPQVLLGQPHPHPEGGLRDRLLPARDLPSADRHLQGHWAEVLRGVRRAAARDALLAGKPVQRPRQRCVCGAGGGGRHACGCLPPTALLMLLPPRLRLGARCCCCVATLRSPRFVACCPA